MSLKLKRQRMSAKAGTHMQKRSHLVMEISQTKMKHDHQREDEKLS